MRADPKTLAYIKLPQYWRCRRLARLSVEGLESRLAPALTMLGPLSSEDWTRLEGTGANLWRALDSMPAHQKGAQALEVANGLPLDLDIAAAASFLDSAPAEMAAGLSSGTLTFAVPSPAGFFQRFSVWEVSIMEPPLADQFPSIRTYRGQGIDDPTATMAADLTPQGFHAQVLSPHGGFFIDPIVHLGGDQYVSYYSDDLRSGSHAITEASGFGLLSPPPLPSGGGGPTLFAAHGETLRTYRTAIAATGEYTTFHGGTVTLGQAAIVTMINRIDGVFETELAIRLTLVGNNSALVYTNATTDPYSDGDLNAMLGQNQSTVDSVIGSANYDLGHVVGGVGGGGLAQLGRVGQDGWKAQGGTSSKNPINDQFWIDFVIHEMGHQFGAHHTFNAIDPNRNAATAYEPGLGTTIMGYAPNEIQAYSDPYFHSASLDQIINYTAIGPGVGFTQTPTNNAIPTVWAGYDYTIPAATPFVLTGYGSDANGDALTYCWEERDLGPAQALGSPDNGLSPLFRSFLPTTDPRRYFPALPHLLDGTPSVAEQLPTTNRTMDFRVTVRDNRAVGAFNDDHTQVTVVNTGTPFRVTAPNTAVTWQGNTPRTVTWDVAGTNGGAINTTHVSIYLSTDGGNTFPILLGGFTPNDGSEVVTIPDIAANAARIKVMAYDNIFFDVSDVNFKISSAGRVGGLSFHDINANKLVDGGEPGLAGRVIYADTNGNAQFDPAPAVTYAAPQLPVAIPDLGTVRVPLSMGFLPFSIADVNVTLNISHPYDSDLDVFLVAPDGTRVELFTDIGGGGDNFFNTVLDDEADTSIGAGFAPFTGRYRPLGPLSAFDGHNPNGTWYLELTDDAGADVGILNSWSLTVQGGYANSSPVSIPDLGVATSNINVGSLFGVVSDVEVQLSINHSYDNDLAVYLTAPTGTKVELFSNVGGSGDNFANTILDDEAAVSITAGVAPFEGRFRPEGNLSDFDGISFNGTWTLTIVDGAGGDTGTLNGWTLRLGRDFSEDHAPEAIPDLGTAALALPVGFLEGPILDLDVTLDIQHTYDTDLEVFLTSPVGTKVELFTHVGFGGDDFTRTTLDDQATVPVFAGAAPFTGTYRPEGLLSAFNGQNPNGSWTLTAIDTLGGDFGSIIDWALTFRTATTVVSTDVPMPIPDLKTVKSSLVVAGEVGPIGDLDVALSINHPYDGDLNVFLIAPNGFRAELFSHVGSFGDNFTNTVLDDEALSSITTGSAPFTGRWRSVGSLSLFDGFDPNGTWYLEVTDDAAADTGTIVGWSITFSAGERYTLTGADGYYLMPNLPPGTVTIREQLPPQWRRTTADSHTVTVLADGPANFLDLDFGSVADVIAPTATITAVSPDPRNSSVDSVQIVFSEPVTGLSVSDLTLTRDFGANLLTGSQTLTTADNITWTLVNLTALTSLQGAYTLMLNAYGSSIIDWALNPFTSAVTGSWMTDTTAPLVTAINRTDPNPTAPGTVHWDITFGESIVTLSKSNFALAASGLSGSAITSVTGSGSFWTVTGSTGSGTGTVGLNLVNSAGVADAAGNGLGNVPFTGQIYTVISPPHVASVVVNNGVAERSRVTSVRVDFDSLVTLPANPADAFQMKRTSDSQLVGLTATVVTDTATHVTLTFTGALSESTSLADGRYTLRAFASKISSTGGSLDGDGDGIPGDDFLLVGDPTVAPKLFRLFGDADGDGDVDAGDYGVFRTSFGGSNNSFDFDNDGDVDTTDFGAFRSRFGLSV